MQESTTREKVLKKIRKALITPTANPYPKLDFESPVFRMNDEVPELIFASAFREAGGNFIFCTDMLEFAENLLNLVQMKNWTRLVCVEPLLQNFLDQCEFPLLRSAKDAETCHAAITACESLVARTGSIMVSSAQASGRMLPAYAPAHIVVAFPDQLVDDLKDAITQLKVKYKDKMPSASTFITGPSRTSAIGNEMITGAQGPAELYLFLVDQPPANYGSQS